ncbi:MAG: DNA-processing protein DprA [Dehalococcoidia bacterium]
MEDLKYWVAFHRISGLGPVRFGRLEAHFGSMAEAWVAGPGELAAAGLDRRTVAEVVRERQGIDPDIEMERLEKQHVTPLHLRSPGYPSQLREIYDPPSVIYIKGDITGSEDRSVAVVGSRRATQYGREMARRLSYDLAAAGVTVISGLARGIDGIAHQSALESGGRTMAVMGGGLDRIYPPEHTQLVERIVERNGAIITEYPLGMRPQAQHFPRRNRVISGLCSGVLVVEANMKSGALLTVKWALDQNREVFAVPGSALSPNSEGPNWLIQQGAKLVVSYRDVIEELNIAVISQTAADDPDDETEASNGASVGGSPVDKSPASTDELNIEERIANFLAHAGGPAHVDEVTRAVGLPAAIVSSGLTVLELKGVVRQVGPMQFASDPDRPVVRPGNSKVRSQN